MIELEASIKGQVQGVGFRWTVVSFAEKLKITGWVKNLKNGDVQVLAQGSQTDLEKFLDSIKKEPGFAKISSIESRYREIQTAFRDFKIIH